MKNIHLLETGKPSRLVKNDKNLLKLCIQTLPLDKEIGCFPQNIYITSDEEIKDCDYAYFPISNEVLRIGNGPFESSLEIVKDNKDSKKIILTTDQDLIKDGVQKIDDEFLEWFVKNPSCEQVEVEAKWFTYMEYKIIIPSEELKSFSDFSDKFFGSIPKEEPKQETLKETAEINLTRLCYYDKRNPDFQIKEEYGYDKEDVEATGNFAKKDCACDNCFYGRSKLTEQLIWQQEKYEALLKEFEQYKRESIKWSVEDFTEYEHDKYTINEEQAQEALERMIQKHDACYGISWDTVDYYIGEYGTVKENNNE